MTFYFISQETALINKTHDIQFDSTSPVSLNVDAEKIGSVIHNLISNAIKYSPNARKIEVACRISGDQVTVSVKDQGIGMTPNDAKKVFDRYCRVENNETKNISGFGIGLYLSAEIVRRHGGTIWADSIIGSGSTFYFSLPLKD